MTNRILGLLAETSLHSGAGQAADVVDLPVAREATTGYPQIPETGLKGALRQWARSTAELTDLCDDLFGTSTTKAGEVLISTARLLFLPVRRLDGPYAWVTCPHLLERLRRDAERAGIDEISVPEVEGANDPAAEVPPVLVNDGTTRNVFLEEYSFAAQPLGNELPNKFRKLVEALVPDKGIAKRLATQLAVMSDREFRWFAEHALPVDARNSLDESKMSENLWYEETLPPDSLFYALMMPRVTNKDADDRADKLFEALGKAGYVQVGGNETVGQGWLRVAVVPQVEGT